MKKTVALVTNTSTLIDISLNSKSHEFTSATFTRILCNCFSINYTLSETQITDICNLESKTV